MDSAAEHERIRDAEDRSTIFRLLDEARAAATPEPEQAEAFETLRCLEDFRSIEPLTAIVEDRALPPATKRAASRGLSGFDDRTTEALRRGPETTGGSNVALPLPGRGSATFDR